MELGGASGSFLFHREMTMGKITSRSNPRIKSAKALRRRKNRKATDLFLVEGIHHVGAAVEAGVALEEIFYAPELLESSFAQALVEKMYEVGVPCYTTSREVFASLADKENPQGIIAVVRQRKEKLTDLEPQNFPWGVACVAPQDPGNVGTILRTIDAVGASGLILIEAGVDPYHPTAVRATMGAIFRHPIVTTTFPEFVQWAESNGYHVYGSSAHGDLDYRQVVNYQRPLILLMGSEREGLTPEQAGICQELVRLPMRGDVTSLNLAVAAGVLLFDILGKMDSS
jgi:TrmH family RNA methyltransferase